MSTRARREEHEAAVARRLQLLGEELAGVRGAAPGLVPEPVVDRVPDTHTRVRVPVEPAPAVLAAPGRHAARRPGSRGWVPEPLRGRVALGPGPLAVVAVLVALGLAVSAWWVVRSEPVAVAPLDTSEAEALATPAAAPAQPPVPGGAGTSEPPGTVTVDVAGKVRRPGIVVLDAGARVVDALREAGGARPGVDLSGLNLARVLVDGEQVVVGVPPPTTGLPVSGDGSTPAPPGAVVDLNTADQVALEALPEVGPVTAQAIITWRDTHGGFTAVSELLEVDGIGEATLATLTPFVTV